MPLPELKLKSLMDKLPIFALAALSLTPSCDAFFRNLMISDTAMARIDPIVNVGSAAKHVHHLNGGRSLDFNSTGQTLATSNCTNSLITVDKSAYWAPWLYFQHDNGTFVPVELALGLTAYYKFEKRGNTGGNVQYSVFPKGLKMLSGDSDKRTWNGSWPVPQESFWGPDDTTQVALQEKAMGFNCMNYQPGKNEPSFAYPYLRKKDFLDQNCLNGVRAEIIFPSCWDGKNLDSDDHHSHLAFPTLIQDGVCPTTHPVYLPILFYETIWRTQDFANVPGEFVFANGDKTGYGYHADFIAAWDDGVQEQVQNNSQCTGLSSDGQIESCPVFDGKTQSQEEARQCKLTVPEKIADEQTEGWLSQLPGGVKITGTRHDPGTDPGPDAEETYAPSTSIPATRSSAMATNPSLIGTGYFHSAVTASPTTLMTITSANQANLAAPSTTVSTYTSGSYVVELVIVEMLSTVTATTTPTSAQTVLPTQWGNLQIKGPSRKRQHLKKHVHNHDHFGQQ